MVCFVYLYILFQVQLGYILEREGGWDTIQVDIMLVVVMLVVSATAC